MSGSIFFVFFSFGETGPCYLAVYVDERKSMTRTIM